MESAQVTFRGEFSKKLVTNTFFNVLGRSWSFAATLLLTPFLITHLSVADFGVWILLSIFTNSFNLLDLGLGSSFIKYISAYFTYEDYESINQVLFSGLAFYGLFGILLTVSGLALERPLFALFHISCSPRVFFLVLLSGSLDNIGAMFVSVFRGVQRMDKANAVEVEMNVLNIVGTVAFLEAGMGLWGLALNALIGAAATIVVAWLTIRRMMPKLHLGFHFNPGLLKDMFGFGAKIQVSQLGGMICFQFDKLVISRYIGIASVSFYEVASRLTSAMRTVPLVLISAIIPATSELGARNDKEKIQRTYVMVSKYVAMLTVAMMAFLILESDSIVKLWIGPGFAASVVLIQILTIGYGVNVMGGAASQTGAGIGRPEFDMQCTVLLSIVNPILSLTLVHWFGAPGAAAGTSIALVIAAIYLLIAFHRNYLGDSMWAMVRDTQLRPIIAGLLAAFATAGFHLLSPQVAGLDQVRYLIPLKLAIDFAVFSGVYFVILVALRQVTGIDGRNFLGLMSFGFEFLRHPFRERVKIYR